MPELGRALELLNDKVDTDIYNATPRLAPVEYYVNGDSGYFIYSNGYCEQWGRYTTEGSVEFLVPFSDDGYAIYTQMLFENYGGDQVTFNWLHGISIYDLTPSGFTYGSFDGNNSVPRGWRAYGFV